MFDVKSFLNYLLNTHVFLAINVSASSKVLSNSTSAAMRRKSDIIICLTGDTRRIFVSNIYKTVDESITRRASW